MSGSLRSKQGCWTCRLRKKKCDECHPYCSTCESLSITCYGYGPRPDWMDSGEKEKEIVNSFKEIVKHTSRRKTTIQTSNRRGPSIKIAPKVSNGSMEASWSGSGSSHQPSVTPPLGHTLPQEDEVDILPGEPSDSTSPEQGSHPETTSSISVDDSMFLMHFLDSVFTLEYPMYQPGVLEGGRGSLLALLLRTKSFYHAALSLSIYHRRMILEKFNHPSQAANLVKQENHLGTCLKLLNQDAQNSCPNMGLGIMASIVQLVFFELFTNRGTAWYEHLHAAMKIYERGYENNLERFGLSQESRKMLCQDLPLYEHDPMVTEEVVNFRFFGGTIIWLDIISSITAGTAPYLQPYHCCIISSNSQTKLEDIMGCKNWMMLQIGRIAVLYEQKTRAPQQGNFDCTELQQTVDDIKKVICCALTKESLEGISISESNPSDPSTTTTTLFAHMATVYLHLVIHGFEGLELLDTTIFEAMRMFRTQVSPDLLPGLVLPLYIIGSVALKNDEQFFRNIFSAPPLLDISLKHRTRILPILEEIWSKRQTTSSFSWKDSLELTSDILLI